MKRRKPRAAAETRALLGHEIDEADLVGRRPFCEKPAKTAVFARNLGNELGVGADGHDFLGVAHDSGIAGEAFPELVGLR